MIRLLSVDAAVEHGKCGITASRIEAYERAKNFQTLQTTTLTKLSPSLTLLKYDLMALSLDERAFVSVISWVTNYSLILARNCNVNL